MDAPSFNLMPPDLLREQAMRKHRNAWLVAISCSAILVSIPLVIEWSDAAKLKELGLERTEMRREQALVRAQLEAATAEANQLFAELERAKALRSKRAWSALVALIGTSLPEGAWLQSIATDPAAPAGGSARRVSVATKSVKAGPLGEKNTVAIDAPRRIRIKGYSLDHDRIYEFMSRMTNTAVFSKVELVSSGVEPAGGERAVGYELLCEW